VRRRGGLLALALLSVVGCSSDQDPGLTPVSGDGTATSSRPLPPCPEGGPDATTPAAGCLDAEGRVVRP
jgi:hypothetical protein